MLSSLSFLIYGETVGESKKYLKELECLYLVNKNQPIRDGNGNPLTAAELRDDLEKRLEELHLESFRPVVNDVLERLETVDDALYYFALVSTFRLPDEKFEKSLKELAVEQNLMFRLNGEYKHRLYSEPMIQNNVPRLPWDLSPVLKNLKITEKDEAVPPQNVSNVKPVDEWGLLSQEFRSILRSEELRLCARERQPIEFFHLKSANFYQKLLDMHRGKSSDLFQLDSVEHFYQSRPCRVEEWNLTTTRTILQKHVYLANQLGEVVHKLKRHFVTGSDNPIRLMMQKYLVEEQQIFSEYFESLLSTDSDSERDFRFQSIFSVFPTLKLDSNRFEVCDELYEIVSAHYHVLREMNEIIMSINNYSPITLNEMTFIGSRSAPQEYARRMWRRLNVTLIRFIINKLAEMLTTSDAELMELLTDAGDVKLIRDPSIWQRLNPLQMESSQCIDSELANRVANLVIGYQFFVNDKKSRSQKSEEETFAKSDIQDAEELELFAKTPEFEKIINDILEGLDVNKLGDTQEELSDCIEMLLEKLPTTTLVERYSEVVLEKSVRFFEFLKKFFTSAYIHMKKRNITSRFTLDIIAQEKMDTKGYDPEFLGAIGYDMKSTREETILSVTPTEPLNIFVTSGVTWIYSQVFTILNMLHGALDDVINTHNSETLTHEPRLRYAFFHMNTTVFAIRKIILGLIDAAYEELKKTLDIKSSKTRSAHEWLDVAYRAHRKFVRDMGGALMLKIQRGTTGRVIRLMVSNVSQASLSCSNGDAVGAEQHYQQFLTNLKIFLDQCRLDHSRFALYRSLEIGEEETDGRRSHHSSYSDDLSCRSY